MSEEKCNHYDTGGICCSDGAFKYKYCKDINDCYYKQLQTAKEENEALTQQNKQMRGALEKAYEIFNECIFECDSARTQQTLESTVHSLATKGFDCTKQALKGGE